MDAPQNALERMANIIQLQIDYLSTAGCASASLPDFLASNCLKEIEGEIEYDFGEESYMSSTSLSEITMSKNEKDTPKER